MGPRIAFHHRGGTVPLRCSPLSFDLPNFILCKAKSGGTDYAIELFCISRADNCPGDCRMSKCPSDGHFPGRFALTPADRAQALDQCQSFRESWFLEIWIPFPPIVCWKICQAVPCHRASQKPGCHWRIDDHADVFPFAERQELFLGIATNQRIGWLQGCYWCDAIGSLQLLQTEIRDTDPAHFSFPLQIAHGCPPFQSFNEIIGRPMDLVQINDVDV